MAKAVKSETAEFEELLISSLATAEPCRNCLSKKV